MYDSDLRVYKLVDNNSSCFSANQVARARSEARDSKKSISDIATIRQLLITNRNAGKNLLGEAEIKILKGMYPTYYPFLNYNN
ncbi:hypothetical protein MCEMSE18_00280 [Candidatus Planktophila versatilis]|uniref:hypothetical protein n=1 Tax=Candidatus Planktophila versatilis TaxID=1884905 RepID=UPI003BEEC3F8